MSIEILSEEKRELTIAEPPKNVLPHLWPSKKEREELRSAIMTGTLLDAYISKRAEAKMRNHALSMREQKIEVLGLLLGDVRKWQERTYLLVRDVITTDLDATAVSVRFDRNGFEKLFEHLDDAGFDYVMVGWYHSHPGYGCYMSDTDIDTQTRMFVSAHHLAIVIDLSHPQNRPGRILHQNVEGHRQVLEFLVRADYLMLQTGPAHLQLVLQPRP